MSRDAQNMWREKNNMRNAVILEFLIKLKDYLATALEDDIWFGSVR
jgi:hypothetical protein